MFLKGHTLLFFLLCLGFLLTTPRGTTANVNQSIQAHLLNTYMSIEELKENEEKYRDWNTHSTNRDSDVVSMSIHGGGIEIGTTQIAKLVAEEGKFNFYSFEGLKPNNNKDLHIKSIHFDDEEAINMVNGAQYALSFHGCRDSDHEVIYLGGKDDKLKDAIKKELIEKGFNSKEAPSDIEGQDNNNITNRTKRDAGVQIELTTKMRKAFFDDYDWSKSKREDRKNWSPKIYDLADAVVKAKQEIN